MFVKRGKVVGPQGVINSTTRPCEEGRNTGTHEWNKNNPDSIYLKIWKKNPTSHNGSNITQYIGKILPFIFNIIDYQIWKHLIVKKKKKIPTTQILSKKWIILE